MKIQFKRFSKSTLAVLLSVCMVVSCLMVGIIATDAAKTAEERIGAVDNSESVGAATQITLYAYIVKNLYDYFSGGINVWGGTSGGVKSTTKVGTTYVSGSTTYYLVKATVYNDNNMVNFKGNDNWWVNSAGTSIDLTTYNCILIDGDQTGSTITAMYYAATPTSANASISGVSGSGTQADPYKLTVGNTYTVNISGVQSDSNMTGFLYNTANNSTGRNTTSTRTLTSDSVSSGNSSTYYVWSYKGTTSNVSSGSKNKTIYYDWIYPAFDGITVEASVSPARENVASVTPSIATDDVDAEDGLDITCTVSDSGYEFVNWTSDNGTFEDADDPETTFYPTADDAVATANVREKSYSVGVSAGTGGTVSPASITAKPYTATNLSTITVTPSTGYHFAGWTSSGVTLTNNSASDPTLGTIKATAAGGTLQATFDKTDYTVTKNTVSGTGCDITISPTTANYGDTITVTCSPATGYKISTVTYGTNGTGSTASKNASDENEWTFSMPAANTKVNATFTKIDYAITKTVSPASSGTISVKRSSTEVTNYNIGDSLTLSATPATHYQFTNFTTSGAVSTTITDNPGTLSMSGKTGAVTITANFAKVDYTGIRVQGMYSTTGASGSYTNTLANSTTGADHGTNQDGIDITAEDVDGYTFVGWVCSGGTITSASSASTKFKPTANNQTVTAQYKKNYSVTASSNNTSFGTAAAAASTVVAGGTTTVTFTPVSGYALTGISVNGGANVLASMKTSAYTYTTPSITADTTVTGTFTKTYTATASLTRKTSDGTTNRIVSGDGTVQVTGGSSSSTTSTATVATGSSVTYTATPAVGGYAFVGWFSDEGCNTLVSKETSYTTTVSADTTLYAMFNKHTYYLTGRFYLADLCREVNATKDNNTFPFTQDSTDPRIYTYENDFMFAYYTGTVTANHLQYVSVGWNGASVYTTEEADVGSGTAAYGTADNLDGYKWMVGDNTAATYPEAADKVNNSYRHVKFTWNSLTETLSWEITDINPEDYVTMYVNGGDYTYDHLWLRDGDNHDTALTGTGTSYGDILLTGTPYIEDNSTVYNVVLVKNSTVTSGSSVCAVLRTSDATPVYGSDVTGMQPGHSYKVTSSTSGTPEEYSPVQYAITIATDSTAHGSTATVSPASSASMNTPVTVTTNPDDGYIATVIVTKHENHEAVHVTRDGDEYSFTMPAADVDIVVDYEQIVPHAINIGNNNPSLGTATASVGGSAATTASVDQTVTLTVTPGDEGMLTGITITGATSGDTITYSPAVTKDGGNYTFTMPNEAVNVAVTFDYYAGLSDYYLDGWYDNKTDGSRAYVLQEDSRQLTTAKLGGVYSYTKVRSTDDFHGWNDVDSLFAIKTPSSAVPADGLGTGTHAYIKVTSSDLKSSDFQYRYSTNSGSTWSSWASMSHVTGDGQGSNPKIWKTPDNVPITDEVTTLQFRKNNDDYMLTDWATIGADTFCAYEVTNTYTTDSNNKRYYKFAAWDGTYDSVDYSPYILDKSKTGSTKAYYLGGDSHYKSNTNANPTNLGEILPRVYAINTYTNVGNFNLPYVHRSLTSDEYYVIVLHANTTYNLTRNGTTYTYTVGAEPEIYASKYLPGEEVPPEPVGKVYAKDGAVRHGYQRFAEHGTTEITKVTGSDGTVYYDTSESPASQSETYALNEARAGKDGNIDWDYIEKIPYGATIEWKTTLDSTYYDGSHPFKDTHYVRGFSVNGVTEEVFDYSSTGVYTGKHVVTETDCKRGHIEITPVYWLKDTTYTKTFYIEGFDRDDTQFKSNSWGDELGIYPYYSAKEGSANAFGGYPGQPMIFYKGTYMQQIPTTHNGLSTGAKVVGMTMSNNYWDLLHREINENDPIYPIASGQHRQTYDFDDFYEIANEKNPLTITFSYRYRNSQDNFGDGAENRNTLTSSYAPASVDIKDYDGTTSGNGVEDYLDAIGRPIDIFGNVLTETQQSATPLLVITNGFKNIYVGKYATEWAVYSQSSGDTYTKITTISPSALAVNSSTNLSKYGASAYSTAYTTLESYKGRPVQISFEKAQTNTSGDVANRLDGRWYYTKTSDIVNADIKIQYDNNDGQGYVNDTFVASTGDDRNKGTTTQARAYFTNYEPNDIYGDVVSGPTQLTAATQYFYLKAEESTNYQFVGWYQEQDGKYIPMEQDAGVTDTHTIIKKSETYYARFKKITSGNVTVKHVIENGTIGGTNYNGSGTPYLTAQILNTDGTVVANFPKSTGTNFVNSKYIRSIYADYTVRVTLETTPDEENIFQTYGLNIITAEGVTTPTKGAETFFGTPVSGSKTNSGACVFEFKVGDLFNAGLTAQEVTGLEYVSRLTKTEYTFQYEINYTFPTRIWNNQTYKVEGTINNDRISTFINLGDPKTSSTLKQSLIENLTPYESNYNQVITWNYAGATQTCTLVSGTTYKIVANVSATSTSDGTVHAEFKLPYQYNEGDTHFAATEYDFYDKAADYTAYNSYTQEQFKALYDANPGQPASVDKWGTTHFTDASGSTTTTVDENSKGVGYDNTVASKTLTSQEARVFNTDNSVTTDREEMKLVTAPDYIYYSTAVGTNVSYHTYKVPCYYFSYDYDATTEDHVKGYQYGGKTFNDGIVADNLVKKYFSRWDVYVDGKIITSCYSKEFNLTAYEDIVVVPVFDSDSPNGNNTGAADQGVKANITFLGTTRNQWNVEGVDVSRVTVTKGGQTYNITATDRLFTDFDVQFADGTNVFREINGNTSGNKKYELGIVIQQLGDLDTTGSGYDTNASTYAAKYAGQYTESAMKAWINGTSSAKPDGFTSVKSVIGTNYLDNDKNFYNHNALLSNKNTTEYYYYFTKSRQGYQVSDPTVALTPTSYNDHLKAYRAIAYIKIYDPSTNTWTTTVSDSPTYFTTYDEAVRTKY